MKNDILLFAFSFAIAWIGYSVGKAQLMKPAADTIVSEETALGMMDAKAGMAAEGEMAAKAGMAVKDEMAAKSETKDMKELEAKEEMAAEEKMAEEKESLKKATDSESTPADNQQSADDKSKEPSATPMKEEAASNTETKAAEPMAAKPKTSEQKIEQVLKDQTDAWNSGDLEGFMDGYWNDEGLTFHGGGKTTLGWEAAYASYQQRYPEGEMGKLNFDDLNTEMVGKVSAIVTGRFEHRSSDNKVNGNFSLVVKMVDGKWKIIHDHTTVN